MSLHHAKRFPDTYSPREIAILARREGFDVQIPDSPQGTPFERARQIVEQKDELFANIAKQRAAKARGKGPRLVR